MKRFHIALSVKDIGKSVKDYSKRLGRRPDVVVPREYALWRTESLNFSIRRSGGSPLRHLGWEDDSARSFNVAADVNGIAWESFSREQQTEEIRSLWPGAALNSASDVSAKIWINGRLADPARPLLSVFDRGFLYGDGVYETMRVYGGRMFHFPEHYRRLAASARGIGLRVRYSRAVLEKAAARVLAANGLEEAVVRVTLTRGPGPLGFDPRPAKTPTCVVMAAPVTRHPERLYREGIRLALARVRRNPRISLDPSLKSTNNLNNILAKTEAIRRRAYEALMLNVDGYLAEGTISNVFFIQGNALKTPSLDCGILQGVTRSAVIAIARRLGLKVVEGEFRPKDLFSADEAFITSTTMEVMPVTKIVDEKGNVRRVGGGRVGKWSPLLRHGYRRAVARETGRPLD